MKKDLKIIQVDGWLIAVDKNYIKGDWIVDRERVFNSISQYIPSSQRTEEHLYKVIAHSGHTSLKDSGLPLLPSITKTVGVETNNWIQDAQDENGGYYEVVLKEVPVDQDVDQQEWFKNAMSALSDEHTIKVAKLCLRAGYNAAQQNKLTIEDMRDAEECLAALSYWDNEELKDGHEGHKIGQMRPMLLVKSFLDKLIQSIQPVPKSFFAEMYPSAITEIDIRDGVEGLDWKWEYKTEEKNGNTYLVGTYMM